ncbi:hypothetical protein ACIBF5_27525 [Micromonospora sp. NPDC050417]|uniref:hypothetical protein n=1 Tax=Micromonospora sp. NPDC050417 TaxID=3364280 RepID=UPI0037900B8E
MTPTVRAINDKANPQYLFDIEPVDSRRTKTEVRSDEIANSAPGIAAQLSRSVHTNSIAWIPWTRFTSQPTVT